MPTSAYPQAGSLPAKLLRASRASYAPTRGGRAGQRKPRLVSSSSRMYLKILRVAAGGLL
jgi:hypothetical protein